MWIIKSFLRAIAIIGLVTIVPYLLWWILTGLSWFEIIDSIDAIGEK